MKPPPPVNKRMAPPPPISAARAQSSDSSLRGPTPTGLVVQVAPPEAARPNVPPPPRSRPNAADASGARNAEQLVGNVLDGRFAIDGVLGEGGMGTVYSGRDGVDNRRIAIKILRSDYLSDSEIVQRFLNEAQAASQIGSPHICSVFGIGGAPNGAAYFVMEFLDGISLSQLLERERILSIRRIIRIGHQIATGLATAHAAGIIHRDLKPDNVMLIQREGVAEFVKIVDFGVAKIASSHSKLTRAGSVFGTPQYMSPEQAAGSVVDARADVYSLGIILYEMCAGTVPFDDENMMNVLTHQMFRDPLAVQSVAPQVVPNEFGAIVRKCLQKDPKLRFASMSELADELLRTAGVLPEGQFEAVIPDSKRPFADQGARGLSATVPELGRNRSSKLGFWVVGAVLSVLLFGLGFFVLAGHDTPQVTADLPAPAAPPPAPRTVELVVTPASAVASRDGAELRRVGTGPEQHFVIELPATDAASVHVAAPGFIAQNVDLRPEFGSSFRVALMADPATLAAANASKPKPPGKPAKLGGAAKAPPAAPVSPVQPASKPCGRKGSVHTSPFDCD